MEKGADRKVKTAIEKGKTASIKYGIDSSGNVVHAGDIPKEKSGLACGLTCVQCGELLISCQGKKTTPYLRHAKRKKEDGKGNVECTTESLGEALVHKLAEQIVDELQTIKIPEASIQLGNLPKYIIEPERTKKILTVEVGSILETPKGEKVLTDLVLGLTDGEEIIVEIDYLKSISDEKSRKLQDLTKKTLVIDLAHLETDDRNLKELIEYEIERGLASKYWEYHPKIAEATYKLLTTPPLKVVRSLYDENTVVWDCPLRLRGETEELSKLTEEEISNSLSSFKIYSYIKDCEKCEHYIGRGNKYLKEPGKERSVLCNAVNTFENLDEILHGDWINLEEKRRRQEKYRKDDQKMVQRLTDNGICTNCGCLLVEEKGSDGEKVLRCSNRGIDYKEMIGRSWTEKDRCRECGGTTYEVKLDTGETIDVFEEGKGIICEKHINNGRGLKAYKIKAHGRKLYQLRKKYPCGQLLKLGTDGSIQYPIGRRRGKKE